MKSLSQRAIFTLAMTGLATVFGTFASAKRLSGQADLSGDLIKIGILLCAGTAFFSFIYWTLARLRSRRMMTGGLAGGLTALTIIPLPFFVTALKSEFMRNIAGEGSGAVGAFVSALLPAMHHGLLTFIDISKFSLIATAGSIAVGLVVAYLYKPPAE